VNDRHPFPREFSLLCIITFFVADIFTRGRWIYPPYPEYIQIPLNIFKEVSNICTVYLVSYFYLKIFMAHVGYEQLPTTICS